VLFHINYDAQICMYTCYHNKAMDIKFYFNL